jgi:hypothetical protein
MLLNVDEPHGNLMGSGCLLITAAPCTCRPMNPHARRLCRCREFAEGRQFGGGAGGAASSRYFSAPVGTAGAGAGAGAPGGDTEGARVPNTSPQRQNLKEEFPDVAPGILSEELSTALGIGVPFERGRGGDVLVNDVHCPPQILRCHLCGSLRVTRVPLNNRDYIVIVRVRVRVIIFFIIFIEKPCQFFIIFIMKFPSELRLRLVPLHCLVQGLTLGICLSMCACTGPLDPPPWFARMCARGLPQGYMRAVPVKKAAAAAPLPAVLDGGGAVSVEGVLAAAAAAVAAVAAAEEALLQQQRSRSSSVEDGELLEEGGGGVGGGVGREDPSGMGAGRAEAAEESEKKGDEEEEEEEEEGPADFISFSEEDEHVDGGQPGVRHGDGEQEEEEVTWECSVLYPGINAPLPRGADAAAWHLAWPQGLGTGQMGGPTATQPPMPAQPLMMQQQQQWQQQQHQQQQPPDSGGMLAGPEAEHAQRPSPMQQPVMRQASGVRQLKRMAGIHPPQGQQATPPARTSSLPHTLGYAHVQQHQLGQGKPAYSPTSAAWEHQQAQYEQPHAMYTSPQMQQYQQQQHYEQQQNQHQQRQQQLQHHQQLAQGLLPEHAVRAQQVLQYSYGYSAAGGMDPGHLVAAAPAYIHQQAPHWQQQQQQQLLLQQQQAAAQQHMGMGGGWGPQAPAMAHQEAMPPLPPYPPPY